MAKPELEFFDTESVSWRTVAGEVGVSQRVLAEDAATGYLTRLVRWDPGLNTSAAGPVAHEYFEEVLVLSGSLYDLRLKQTFGAGYYACRPPGMLHGPWESAEGCIMLETRYEPDRARTGRRVLIIGLDPDAIPGVDAAAVRAGLEHGLARFDGSDLTADQCLVPLDATAERRITEALTREPYDCVVVGGGIRKPEPLLEFFEAVINLIRLHAPHAAIAFNTDGGTSLEAAGRALTGR